MTAMTTATPPPREMAAKSERRRCRRIARRLMMRRTAKVEASCLRATLRRHLAGFRRLEAVPPRPARVRFDTTVAKSDETGGFFGNRQVVGDHDDRLTVGVEALEGV